MVFCVILFKNEIERCDEKSQINHNDCNNWLRVEVNKMHWMVEGFSGVILERIVFLLWSDFFNQTVFYSGVILKLIS